MTLDSIEASLGTVLEDLPTSSARGLPIQRGRVLDRIQGRDLDLLVASDRLWGLDRVLGTIPFKGEIQARLSAYWLRACGDLCPNHLLEGPDSPVLGGSPRAWLVRKTEPLPFRVRVRGYLAGEAWADYQAGRKVCGLSLPEGLRNSEKFPIPLVSPDWDGQEAGEIGAGLWDELEELALALFRRGQEMAFEAGLILVDSAYEFGLVDGHPWVCGDLHSLESSHYWWAAGYPSLFPTVDTQRDLDGEAWRPWLASQSFDGRGKAPVLPDRLRAELALAYIQAFETITGEFFESLGTEPQAEAEAIGRIVERELLGS